MFIDVFAGYVYLWAFRNDQWKTHSFGARSLAPQENALNSGENKFTDRETSGRRLLLQLAVERPRNINRGANGFFFHRADYCTFAINMAPHLESCPKLGDGTGGPLKPGFGLSGDVYTSQTWDN